MRQINWQQTCCAHHGEYAEAPTVDGGIARIKQGPEIDGYLVCAFDANGKATQTDADGVPAYVLMDEAALSTLIT